MRDEPAFDTPPPKALPAWLWVAILGFAIVWFWFTVLYVVPINKKRLDTFAALLPYLTRVVLTVSSWFATAWFVLIPASVAAIAILANAIRTGTISNKAGKRLAQIATLLLFASIVVSGIALAVPQIKLAYDLSK